MFTEFVNQYGMTILYTIITAVASYVGLKVKAAYEKHINTKEKQEIAETVVQYAEQVYNDLHGEEKLNKAIEAASEMLAEHDIKCSQLEIRVLIEAAVNSFNAAVKTETATETATEDAAEELPADSLTETICEEM